MDIQEPPEIKPSMNLTALLKIYAGESGADLVGIADLNPFKAAKFSLPADLLEPYVYAVSVAMRLDKEIIDRITDHPTPEYAGHYRRINSALDALTLGLSRWIQEKGCQAHPIPASHITDEKNLAGNISHKAVARMAGIGWQGKSLLIVTPEFGPRIRLATILTDMPLEPDTPLKNRCGKCTECAKACPSSAIKNASTESHYSDREEALHFSKCAGKTVEFSTMPGIGARICGVCVMACPFGRKSRSGSPEAC
jgi:epoxyqueuosine reductase QueG